MIFKDGHVFLNPLNLPFTKLSIFGPVGLNIN